MKTNKKNKGLNSKRDYRTLENLGDLRGAPEMELKGKVY